MYAYHRFITCIYKVYPLLDPKKDISAHPRLEPFSPGQVYHAGKAKQVHVLPPIPKEHLEAITN